MEIEDLPISLVTYWGGGPISRQVVETPFCSPSSPPESLFSSSPSNDCDLNIDDINILKLISSVDEVKHTGMVHTPFFYFSIYAETIPRDA